MLHISSLAARCSVTDVIFITVPLHSLSSVTFLGPTTYKRALYVHVNVTNWFVHWNNFLQNQSMLVNGFCLDAFMTVGLFVQWMNWRKCWGRGAEQGQGGGDHLWASRLLVRHVAGPAKLLDIWAKHQVTYELQKYTSTSFVLRTKSWYGRMWIRLALRWSRWLVGSASCSGVGAGEWHWCLKTATRRVARSRRSKKLHSQTLWAQTILAREQNWSVSEWNIRTVNDQDSRRGLTNCC